MFFATNLLAAGKYTDEHGMNISRIVNAMNDHGWKM
jgi:hypothetical protein